MTDDELESQAKLWHGEKTMGQEKTQRLSAQLKAAQPQARTRRRWQLVGVALAALGLPLSGITALVLSANSLAQKTKIELLKPEFGADFTIATTNIILAPDETILANFALPKSNTQLWKPSRSRPEKFILPESVAPSSIFPDREVFDVYILHNGEIRGQIIAKLVGYAGNQKEINYGVFFRKGKWTILYPLPGYQGSTAYYSTAAGVKGTSYKYGIMKPVRNTSGGMLPNTPNFGIVKDQPTLWHEGKPEPLGQNPITQIPENSGFATNAHGDALILSVRPKAETTNPYSVRLGKTIIPVLTEEKDSQGEVIWEAQPKKIGKEGMLVGTISRESEGMGAIWTTPSAKPRPLWEKPAVFGKVCLSCEDVDEEGKVVGTMADLVTNTPTAFVWKDGRYLDLQTLVPRSSGWHVEKASQVVGRFILAQGTDHGKPAYFRINLPPGCP